MMARPWLPRPELLRRSLASASAGVDAVERAALEAVWARYALGSPRDFKPLGAGWRGNSFVVAFAPGRQAVLKRYKSTMTQEAIAYEHAILLHLEAIDFPAARLIRNAEGGTDTIWNDRHYAVFAWVAGFRYTDFFVTEATRRRHIASAGAALAGYHRSVDGMLPEGRKRDGYRPDGRARWESLEHHVAVLQTGAAQLAARQSLHRDERAFLRQLPRRRDELAALEDEMAVAHAALHKLPIHGDFSPSNALFTRDGRAIMLDFECARLDLRAYDVAFSLVAFARRGMTLDTGRERAFFEAYQSAYPLARQDVQHLPAVFRWVQLRSLVDAVRDCLNEDAKAAARALARLHWVDWMAAHGQQLVDVLLET